MSQRGVTQVAMMGDPRRRFWLVALGWLAFTLATERWMAWGDPIRLLYATDELQYESMAKAAPGLTDAPVSAAAGQRVTAHWLVGVVSDATSLGLHTVYRIVAYAFLLAIAAVMVELCVVFRLPEWASVLALGIVLTNPYTVRLLVVAPAMLSDAVLVLGVAIALLGLAAERPWLAVAGCVVAVLGREMGLPVALGTCAWLTARRLLVPAALAVIAPLGAFGAVKIIGETFAEPNPSAHAFTVVSPLLRLPGTVGLLADHIGRIVIAAPVALASLTAALLVLGLRHQLSLRQDPFCAALLLTALMLVQVVVFNPDWVQHNESRLAALGIVPLAMAAAEAVVRTGVKLSWSITVVAAGGVAVASLQHRFSDSGLLVSGAVYVTVAMLIAGALALLILLSSRRNVR
jgi:hypothetical protein